MNIQHDNHRSLARAAARERIKSLLQNDSVLANSDINIVEQISAVWEKLLSLQEAKPLLLSLMSLLKKYQESKQMLNTDTADINNIVLLSELVNIIDSIME
jgi:hypothetical protein